MDSIELSLEHLASVSGGEETIQLTGKNCTVTTKTDKAGNTTLTMTCRDAPDISGTHKD